MSIIGYRGIRPGQEPLLMAMEACVALLGVGLHSPLLGAVTRLVFAAISAISTLHFRSKLTQPYSLLLRFRSEELELNLF